MVIVAVFVVVVVVVVVFIILFLVDFLLITPFLSIVVVVVFVVLFVVFESAFDVNILARYELVSSSMPFSKIVASKTLRSHDDTNMGGANSASCISLCTVDIPLPFVSARFVS